MIDFTYFLSIIMYVSKFVYSIFEATKKEKEMKNSVHFKTIHNYNNNNNSKN